MKRFLLCLAFLLAPITTFADPPPAPEGVVDAHCEKVPPQIASADLANFLCNPRTGEWARRTRVDVPAPSAMLAQAAPAEAAEARGASSAATAAPSEETSPDIGELVSDAGKVIDDWKNLGWLAGVIALINLLLNVMRFTPIEKWLAELDYKWIKPLIATLLGAALGGFSVFSTGAGVLNSIVAGAMAGLGSVGFHELMDKTRKRTTKPAEA